MKHSSFLTIASLAFVSLPFLTSCQDEDFGYTSEQISYRTNFDKMFGKASNIPTFDLSTYNLNKMGLMGGPAINSETRANQGTSTGDIFSVVSGSSDGYFYVPQMLQNWLDKNLVEKDNNKSKGSIEFQFTMPDHPILIIPIYQGQSGQYWNLVLSESGDYDDTNNKLVWKKSDLLEVRTSTGGGIQYTNNQKGETKTYTIPGSQFVARDDRDKGGNNEDLVFTLNNFLTDLGFDKNNEWLKIEVSGLASSGNGTIRCDPGNTTDVCIGSVSYNNGTVIYNVQNEKVLSSSKIELVQWYPKPHTYNNDITVKITRYQKTVDTGAWKAVSTLADNSHDENDKKTINQVTRSKAIQINPAQVPSGVFSLYLDIQNLDSDVWSGNTWRQHYSSRQDMWSTNGMMVALPAIQNDRIIGEDLQYQLAQAYGNDRTYENLMILGCEDTDRDLDNCSTKHGSDWDMNDIVFLIVGMSQENIIKKTDVVVKKRYMIEDLGSTFDFDFNDMVVDVTQIQHKENNVIKSRTTTATLKHLCGTIPFKIKIGNTTFGPYPGNNANAAKGEDGYNPEGVSTYSNFMNATVDGWDPDQNNIIVTTWPEHAGMTASQIANINSNFEDSGNNASDHYLNILGAGNSFGFPTEGQYPYIIATDQTVNWMKELITIPKTWFTVAPKNSNPEYGTGDAPTPGPTYLVVNATSGTNCSDVTITSDPTPSVAGQYAPNATITLTATPTDQYNYQFLGWFKDGATTAVSTNATYTFTLTDATAGSYTANYDLKNKQYELSGTAINFALKTAAYSVMIPGSKFPTASSIGNKTYRMTLNFSGANTSGATIHILETDGEWSNIAASAALIVNSNGTATYTVDINSSNLSNYTGGIAIQRNSDSPNLVFVSGTIAEVTGEGSNTGSVETLWSSDNFTTGGSNSHSKIDIDTSKLAVGKTLKIYFDGSNGKWLNIHYGQNSWDNQSYGTGNPRSKVLTQDDVTAITNNDLYVQGDNTKVTKVTIE